MRAPADDHIFLQYTVLQSDEPQNPSFKPSSSHRFWTERTTPSHHHGNLASCWQAAKRTLTFISGFWRRERRRRLEDEAGERLEGILKQEVNRGRVGWWEKKERDGNSFEGWPSGVTSAGWVYNEKELGTRPQPWIAGPRKTRRYYVRRVKRPVLWSRFP